MHLIIVLIPINVTNFDF